MPHSTTIAHSTPVTITGTWEGALYSAHGQQARHFVLYQPARGAQSTLSAGPLGNCGITLVALAERAQLLIEARLRGDNMVGHWVQRDGDGRVQGEGELVAGRV